MDEQEMQTPRDIAEAMGLTNDLNPQTNKPNVLPMKPSEESEIAIVKRLKLISMKRRAKTPEPEFFAGFASSLSRFPLPVIDQVCTQIEETPRRPGEPSFPDLGTIIEMCRREASRVIPREGHRLWKLGDYKECVHFDRYLKEQITPDPHHPQRATKTQAEVLAAHPSHGRQWIAWRNLMDFGMIDCPEWCEECEGARVVLRYEDGSKPYCHGDYSMSQVGANNRALETEKRKKLTMISPPCPTCRLSPVSRRKLPYGVGASSNANVIRI